MCQIEYIASTNNAEADVECFMIKDGSLYWQSSSKSIYVANFYFKLTELICGDSGNRYKVEIYKKKHDQIYGIHTGYYTFEEFGKLNFFEIDRHLVPAANTILLSLKTKVAADFSIRSKI